ncbi:hypothetical protein AWB75_04591 [Caballeronia catudaia]|uniref:Uncharacterized protein n=1 Tax=Caballeronia catudaia TaxID=1777136 RepID=A0A158C6J8_9BURK|nr:hypothetical protein AWB75_04591 [Caballeronia catudaia]
MRRSLIDWWKIAKVSEFRYDPHFDSLMQKFLATQLSDKANGLKKSVAMRQEEDKVLQATTSLKRVWTGRLATTAAKISARS